MKEKYGEIYQWGIFSQAIPGRVGYQCANYYRKLIDNGEIIDDNFNLVRREVVNVPLVGTVAAGQPVLAVENIEGYFPIPAEFMPNEQSFMLKVKGESMVNAGIFDGDQVLVKQQSTASDGDIVVALVDEGATVKTFYKEKGYYRLQPENDSMDPIIIRGDLQILGKVFGVFRLYQ